MASSPSGRVNCLGCCDLLLLSAESGVDDFVETGVSDKDEAEAEVALVEIDEESGDSLVKVVNGSNRNGLDGVEEGRGPPPMSCLSEIVCVPKCCYLPNTQF